VVLINGEKQVGKSTFANHLANLLLENQIAVQTYSFVGIYESLLTTFMTHIYGEEANYMTYEDMKKAQIVPGINPTGRDWLIQVGNASRALHPYLLPLIFKQYAIRHPEIDVWVIENWGFQDEWECMTDLSFSDGFPTVVQLTTIHLNERASRVYKPGEQFDGDNRFNLEVLAQAVNPKVNRVAAQIDREHEYPVDTIMMQFNPPPPEPEVEEVAADEQAAVEEPVPTQE
jgi:hypothetical protein